MKNQETGLMPLEVVERKIYLIRGLKVILDSDLAFLYKVPTFRLNEAVKRNRKRFPPDFMFRLTEHEVKSLTSHIAILKRGQHRKYLPYVFTEQGVAMLSSVLKSETAIQVNIAIVRAFIKLRELLSTHKDLIREIEKIKREQKGQNYQIEAIIDTINKMLNPPLKDKKEPMGFRYRGRK